MVRQCVHCEKWYTPKAKDRVTFCSRDCSYAHRRVVAGVRAVAAEVERLANQVHSDCTVCGKSFVKKMPTQLLCSPSCRATKDNEAHKKRYQSRPEFSPTRVISCLVCGKKHKVSCLGRGSKRSRYCSDRCSKRAAKKTRYLYERMQSRLRKSVVRSGERINPFDIFSRDGWRCQLCGKTVKRDAQVPDYEAPVLDHILPIAKGGEHKASNLQCAHFICNSRRSHLVPSQGRLFG